MEDARVRVYKGEMLDHDHPIQTPKDDDTRRQKVETNTGETGLGSLRFAWQGGPILTARLKADFLQNLSNSSTRHTPSSICANSAS